MHEPFFCLAIVLKTKNNYCSVLLPGYLSCKVRVVVFKLACFSMVYCSCFNLSLAALAALIVKPFISA